jgi:hypothetical protein
METDEIFDRAYQMLGISLEDMFGMSPEDDLDEMEAAFLSGTYIMGVAIDRYFHMPFSYFLKLIRPHYMLPFDFGSEIIDFLDSPFEEDELYSNFFAPCSRYLLTDLGLRYFKVKPSKKNYFDVKTQLPYDSLVNDLDRVVEALTRHGMDNDGFSELGTIYSLMVRFDAACWLHLDVPADFTLRRLFGEIAMIFGLNKDMNYSFYHDKTANPFAEYASTGKSNSRKSIETPLDQLDFEHQRTLILSVYGFDAAGKPKSGRNAKAIMTFTMEWKSAEPRNPGRTYPDITRMSKKVREMMEG